MCDNIINEFADRILIRKMEDVSVELRRLRLGVDMIPMLSRG